MIRDENQHGSYFQEMAKTAQARKGIQTSPDGKREPLCRVYEARSVKQLLCDLKTPFTYSNLTINCIWFKKSDW